MVYKKLFILAVLFLVGINIDAADGIKSATRRSGKPGIKQKLTVGLGAAGAAIVALGAYILPRGFMWYQSQQKQRASDRAEAMKTKLKEFKEVVADLDKLLEDIRIAVHNRSEGEFDRLKERVIALDKQVLEAFKDFSSYVNATEDSGVYYIFQALDMYYWRSGRPSYSIYPAAAIKQSSDSAKSLHDLYEVVGTKLFQLRRVETDLTDYISPVDGLN